jgi:Ni,Fe-hydrogenase maturation factor
LQSQIFHGTDYNTLYAKIKQMKVYVFGNEDLPEDRRAFEVAKKLEGKIKEVQFVKVKPNEDVPFIDEKFVVILDVIEGIKNIIEIHDDDLDKLILPPRSSVHDFDLGFQVKYLKKIGKIGKVTIIGLPMREKIDYFLIQSILRKLVAQEMQGS